MPLIGALSGSFSYMYMDLDACCTYSTVSYRIFWWGGKKFMAPGVLPMQ